MAFAITTIHPELFDQPDPVTETSTVNQDGKPVKPADLRTEMGKAANLPKTFQRRVLAQVQRADIRSFTIETESIAQPIYAKRT